MAELGFPHIGVELLLNLVYTPDGSLLNIVTVLQLLVIVTDYPMSLLSCISLMNASSLTESSTKLYKETVAMTQLLMLLIGKKL